MDLRPPDLPDRRLAVSGVVRRGRPQPRLILFGVQLWDLIPAGRNGAGPSRGARTGTDSETRDPLRTRLGDARGLRRFLAVQRLLQLLLGLAGQRGLQDRSAVLAQRGDGLVR